MFDQCVGHFLQKIVANRVVWDYLSPPSQSIERDGVVEEGVEKVLAKCLKMLVMRFADVQ